MGLADRMRAVAFGSGPEGSGTARAPRFGAPRSGTPTPVGGGGGGSSIVMRAPRAVGAGPGGLMELLQKGVGERRGPAGLLAAYGDLPWLHAVVSRIAMSTASTEWIAYRPAGIPDGPGAEGRRRARALAVARRAQAASAGGKSNRAAFLKRLKQAGELEVVDDHPILDLLHGGNAFMPGLTVRYVTQASLDIVGEAFQIIERDGATGRPRSLLPVPRSWVKRLPTPDDPTFEVAVEGTSVTEPVPLSDMIYIQMPDLRNPYGRGLGTAESLGDELATDEYAARHTVRWFSNGARPDLLIYGEGLKQEETQRLEAKWNAKFRGVANAFKAAFLSKSVDVVELNASLQAMQFTELRKFERDTIRQVYGVPPEVLGIVENSNRATIEAADYLYARWVLVPRLDLQAAGYQHDLVPAYGGASGIVLGYENPVQEDKEHQRQIMSAHPYAFTVDDFREAAGLEPLPDEQGQVFPVPFFQRTPALAPDAPPPAPEPDPEPVGRGAKQGEPPDAPEGAPPPEPPEEEPALALADIAVVLGAVGAEALVDALLPVVREAALDFGADALAEVDPDLTYQPSQRVLDYIERTAGEKIRGANETTVEALRAELAEGVGEGEGVRDLAARVERVFDDASRRRAETIARTEVVGASNTGALDGYRAAGVPAKEWLSARQPRTRETHQILDGQRQHIEADFVSSSGAHGPCPGRLGRAEEDINCRCSVAPVLEPVGAQGDSGGGEGEELRAARWRAFDRERYPYENRMRVGARRAFRQQEREALAALREAARGVRA